MSLKECHIHMAIALFVKEKPKVGKYSNKNNNMENVQKIKISCHQIASLQNIIKLI